jgi:hypothetical protein
MYSFVSPEFPVMAFILPVMLQTSDTKSMENSPTRDLSYDSFLTKFRFLFKHTLKCKSTQIFAY